MRARPLLLVAVLAIGASEVALWLQLRDALRAQADISRRVDAHRCRPVSAAPVPGEGDFFTARMPEYPRLIPPPMTDPALEGHRG